MWQSITYYTVLACEALLGVLGIRLYEPSPYTVVDTLYDGIEIRQYEQRLAAEVVIPSAGEAGRDDAFRILFNYIAGANQRAISNSEKIAMTIPVETRDKTLVAMTVPVQTEDQKSGVRMRFFLPARYINEPPPIPTDERVRIVTVAPEFIAAKRFSGTAGAVKIDAKKSQLLLALETTEWQPTGETYTLFYDAPFTLPPFRRNEVVVAITPRVGKQVTAPLGDSDLSH